MKKYGIICILCGMLLSLFSSCNSDTVTEEESLSQGQSETAVETETEPATRNLSNLPEELTFDGADFRIMGRTTIKSVCVEEANGDTINDAVFERDNLVKEQLDVTLSIDKMERAEINALVLAGDTSYSAVVHDLNHMCGMINSGYLYNVDAIPHLDTTQSYWFSSVTEDMRFAGKSYVFAGDICLTDDLQILCMYFNKTMMDELQIPDHFALVEEGKWTMDFLLEQIAVGSMDLDGDGQMTWQEDRWAILDIQNFMFGIFSGMGQFSVVMEDGHYVYNMHTESAVNALEKLVTMFEMKDTHMDASTINTTDKWTLLDSIFGSGRALYDVGVLNNMSMDFMRNMEDEFGVIPMPKYDEKQEEYVSLINQVGFVAYGVPVNAADLTFAGAVLECMAGYSTDTLHAAVLEDALPHKLNRNEESAYYIDMIFNSARLDVGFCYFGLRDIVLKAVTSGAIVSTIESNAKSMETSIAALEKTLTELKQ